MVKLTAALLSMALMIVYSGGLTEDPNLEKTEKAEHQGLKGMSSPTKIAPMGGIPLSRVDLNGTTPWTVTDETGSMLNGAQLYGWNAQKVHGPFISDPFGRLPAEEYQNFDGSVLIYEGYAPAFFTRDEMLDFAGEILLNRRLALAGNIALAGDDSGNVPWIEVNCQDLFPKSAPPQLLGMMDMLKVKVSPGNNGNFQLIGLDENWSGTLSIPEDFSFFSYSGNGSISGGAIVNASSNSWHAIKTFKNPVLTGRFVNHNGSPGVQGIGFSPAGLDPLGVWHPSTNCETDKNGAFRIPMKPTNRNQLMDFFNEGENYSVPKIEVVVHKTSISNSKSFIFDGPFYGGNWDIGSIILDPVFLCRASVVDKSGDVIPGSYATRDEDIWHAGNGGRISFPISPTSSSIIFCAPGFIDKKIDLLHPFPADLTIAMEEAPGLKVLLQVEGNPSDLKGLLHLSGEGTIALNSIERTWRESDKNGFGYPVSRYWEDEHGESHLFLDFSSKGLTNVIYGLVPDKAISCQVESTSGVALSERVEFSLRSAETLSITMVVANDSWSIHGVVNNVRGIPVPGVQAFIFTKSGPVFVTTDEKGEFEIPGLGWQPYNVTLHKKGLGKVVIDHQFPTNQGEPLHVMMEPSRDLEVYWVNPSGEYIGGGRLAYHSGFADNRSGKAQRLEDAPRSKFELEWRLGALEGISVVPPDTLKHWIQIPYTGTLELSLERNAEDGSTSSLVVCYINLESASEEKERVGFLRRHNFFIKPGENMGVVVISGLPEGKYSGVVEYYSGATPQSHSIDDFSISDDSRTTIKTSIPR